MNRTGSLLNSLNFVNHDIGFKLQHDVHLNTGCNCPVTCDLKVLLITECGALPDSTDLLMLSASKILVIGKKVCEDEAPLTHGVRSESNLGIFSFYCLMMPGSQSLWCHPLSGKEAPREVNTLS